MRPARRLAPAAFFAGLALAAAVPAAVSWNGHDTVDGLRRTVRAVPCTSLFLEMGKQALSFRAAKRRKEYGRG